MNFTSNIFQRESYLVKQLVQKTRHSKSSKMNGIISKTPLILKKLSDLIAKQFVEVS